MKIFLEYGQANCEYIEVADDCKRVIMPDSNFRQIVYEIVSAFRLNHGCVIFHEVVEIPAERLEILFYD